MPSHWLALIYFLVGQAAWFICVIGAAKGWSWIGPAFVLMLIAAHVARSARPCEELKLIGSVMAIGAAWETALIGCKLLSYPSSTAAASIAPAWLVALWALFAAQFNTSYRWLKRSVVAGALVGAAAGPLSFRAGAALGAVRFLRPVPAAITLAAGWAVLLPLLILLSRRWDGVATRET